MLDQQKTFEIEIESEEGICQFAALTIANAAPPTSILEGAGQVLINDGLLDVTIATEEGKLHAVTTMLKLLAAAIAKTKLNQEDVIRGRTRYLKVTTNPPQKVVVDGELIGTTPIEVKCIPSGLTVLIPKAFASSQSRS